MSTRATETVKGIETTLAVDKAGGETPAYIVIGCATDINYTSDIELLTANCYAGKEMHPSGDDAVKSFTLNGIVKEYDSTNEPLNVSAADLEAWHDAKTLKKFKYARPHVGDTVRSFDGYVTAYSESGTTNGFQTYTATVTPKSKPVVTVVAS